MRDAVGEELGRRNLQRDRGDVVAGEHVLDRRLARAGDAAEVARTEVDEVEDALLVELIRIVEVAGDDARPVRERRDEGVDEVLVVQPLLAAGAVARVVALERAEAVDEAVSLRAVVVGEDLDGRADDRRIRLAGRHDARDRHRLGAAGELPEELVAAAEVVGGARRPLGRPAGTRRT